MKPELKTLETTFNQVETRYRLIKKQQETILDRLVDDGNDTEEQLLLTTKKLGDKVKADFLQIVLKFAAYQKEQNFSETSKSSVTLEAIINVVNVNSSGKNGRYTRIKTKLEWSTTIASTNMGWRLQILCHLEKGIQSLDDKIQPR